jgi:hypothetical protein
VREDEPTSFIAFALESVYLSFVYHPVSHLPCSSRQHRDYLASRKRALGRASVSSESENFGDDLSTVESGSNWGLVSLDAPTPKDLLKDEGPALETKGTSPLFSKTVAPTLI